MIDIKSKNKTILLMLFFVMWILILMGCAVVKKEAFISISGSGCIGAGSVGLPVRIFNPHSKLPYLVPNGKKFLLYGLFFESDPPIGEAMLMGVFITKGNEIHTVRTLHLRKPGSLSDNLTAPNVISEGSSINLLIANTAFSNQSFNYSLQGKLIDSNLNDDNVPESGAGFKRPNQASPYPALKINLNANQKSQLAELLKDSGYILREGGNGSRITLPYNVLSQKIKQSELLLNVSKGLVGRINARINNTLELDNDILAKSGDLIVSAGIAKAGSKNGLLVDPGRLPDCSTLKGSSILYLSLDSANFYTALIANCILGQIALNAATDVSLKPGDLYVIRSAH